MDSFILGMTNAIKYKDGLARMVIAMYGQDVLKEHVVIMEGYSKTGHRINIPITESMLLNG